MSGNILVRTADRPAVDAAVELAAAEGWNPGLSDATAFLAADPGGFFAAGAADDVDGTISAVRYGDSYAFLGFFIVKKSLRGTGIGRALWEAALRRTGGRVTGLDSVPQLTGYYERHGFVSAYRSVRYLARSGQTEVAPGIVPLGRVRFAKVEEYDRRHFPAPRTTFLDLWVRASGSHGLAAVRDASLEGYGLVRPCRSGWKVGPLFADSRSTAEALFSGLLSSVPEGEDVFLDVPLANTQAAALASSRRLTPVFETVRMYRGGVPATPVAGIYGVTSFELG
jgi:GNAT superfamily N-acetyltransferase